MDGQARIRRLGVAFARQAADEDHERADFVAFCRLLTDGSWQLERGPAWLRYHPDKPFEAVLSLPGAAQCTVTAQRADDVPPDLLRYWRDMVGHEKFDAGRAGNQPPSMSMQEYLDAMGCDEVDRLVESVKNGGFWRKRPQLPERRHGRRTPVARA